MIVVREGSPIEIKECIIQPGGRVIGLRVSHSDNFYFIVNVYAPTKQLEKVNIFKDLYLWLKKT